MAFIYNLTDTWNDVTTTWNGIKLAVTNTGADSSSKLLNLTVTGASTASFVVDKSGNLALNGSVNKITMTAPATGATLTLADGSSFITSGAHDATFTFSGSTSLTFPTSGTVTALGNTTTGSGSIVLATSPTLSTPALGTPSSVNLTNAVGLPISTGLTGTGSGVLTALAVNVGSAGAFVTFNGALGTPSSGNLSNCTGYPAGGITGLGTGVAAALAVNVGSAGAIVVQNGVLGTPSSGVLTNATGLPLTTGVTGTLPVANGGTGITSFGTGVATALGVNVGSAGAFVVNGGALGTPSSGTLTNATGLPISTGVSGLGTGVATFLATPSSANLASAVTDETGSGPLVFATSPTFTSQVTLGTQSTTRGTLVLANTTAGSKAVTLQSSNSTAAAYTLTLPAAAPVNGYYLQTDNLGNLSWAAGGGGGGGSPGGSNTQVQFNDSANFGGAAAFTYDKTTYTLGLGVASTTTGIFSLYNSSSANAVSIKSGNNASAWSLTLPTSGGSANYFLQTDGSGNTTWAAAAAGTINTGTVGQITYYSGTNTLSGTTTGTGVLTALGINVGTTGAFVAQDGALGTPLTGTLTNCTGLPVASGISGLGTGVATALANNTNIAGGVLVPAAALTANALVVGGGSGTGPSTVTTGTGVVTALGVNTGSAGAFVVNGGALGTPSSGTLTNCTGLPIASGISGLGTGVATALAVNVGTAGAFVVNGGALGTPSSGTLTNCTGIPAAGITGTLGVANGGTGTSTAFTAGSVVFAGASGTYSQDNANFFWDDTNNRLGIGTNSPSGFLANKLVVATGGTANEGITIYSSSNNGSLWFADGTTGSQSYAGGIDYSHSADTLVFYSNASGNMRLDASGNLGLGVTPSAWSGFTVAQYKGGFIGSQNNAYIYWGQNGYYDGTNWTRVTNSAAASLYEQSAGKHIWYNAASGSGTITWTQALTLDASGNLLLGGTAARGTTVGAAHLDIFNGTAPAGTLTNGISLYSSSGDFNFMDASGNGYQVGFRNVPQNSQSAAYTAVLADSGKQIFHPSTDNNARTFTIPANSSVAYPVGTVLTFINRINTVTISITTDTMYLAGAGTTGNRTLAANGVATAVKISSTEWIISGTGLT